MQKTINNPQLKGKYYYGLGRRKTAIVKTRLYDGSGKLYVNQTEITDKELKDKYLKPLVLTGNNTKFDITVVANGGGAKAWIDATILAIARALIKYDKNYKQTLRKYDLLKRDPRMKERKKPGLRKARRAPQWSKR